MKVPPLSQNRLHRTVLIGMALFLGALVALAIIYVRQWPFTRESITQALQQQTGSTVQIGSFRQFYFPRPGCAAENVTLRRGGGAQQPLIAIRRLTISGSYSGLLIRHIDTVRAEGLHISIPSEQQQAAAESSSPVKVASLQSGLTIGEIVADGAQIDIPATDRVASMEFHVPRLTVRDIRDGQAFTFQTTVKIPRPFATVDVEGKFGPWQSGNAGQTRLSGSYSLRDLDLYEFDGVAGIVTSLGKFDGILQHVLVEGTTDTPKFEVMHSGHSFDLATQFHAVVNGLDGDVELEPVVAHFAKTTIVCTGTIAGNDKEPGKTANLQVYSSQARIQDLLRMFVSEKTPPMSGAIQFRTSITLPPDNRGFLDRIRLKGDFGISGAQYPDPDTQRTIDVLSARAQGKADKVEDTQEKMGGQNYDPGRVLSNVKGHVILSNAVAKLNNVTFDVPGASAQVSGTYNLKTEQIDFQGLMTLETELSKATTGVKSFLLKVIQPLTASKKHKHESVVSLKITGTYHNPNYVVLPIAKK